MVILGGGVDSYERGTPVARYPCMLERQRIGCSLLSREIKSLAGQFLGVALQWYLAHKKTPQP